MSVTLFFYVHGEVSQVLQLSLQWVTIWFINTKWRKLQEQQAATDWTFSSQSGKHTVPTFTDSYSILTGYVKQCYELNYDLQHPPMCLTKIHKQQVGRHSWAKEWTTHIEEKWGKVKGYGLQNILLRSTFSLQYGQVCFFPTIHQPRMQNSWNLHWVSLRKT